VACTFGGGQNDETSESIVHALAELLGTSRIPDFCALIADSSLLHRSRSGWALERISEGVAKTLKQTRHEIPRFLNACRVAKSPLADTLAAAVLSHIDDTEQLRSQYLLEALDAGRASIPEAATSVQLLSMFNHHIPISGSQYEIVQRSNNELRQQLYDRAQRTDSIAFASRRLLASLELERMESGRPSDELRHPKTEDGLPWTDVFRQQ
jgi:hypothetical protein